MREVYQIPLPELARVAYSGFDFAVNVLRPAMVRRYLSVLLRQCAGALGGTGNCLEEEHSSTSVCGCVNSI